MFDNIFEIRNIAIYLIIINIMGFIVMYLDKKKAEKDYWRFSEKSLLTITALGGGIGIWAGMYKFRHKTKKPKFTIGVPLIIILEIAVIIISRVWK